jgi:hypothetical protein
VAATDRHRRERGEPVTVMNRSTSPVPVTVQGPVTIGNTSPIPVVVTGGGSTGGGSTAPTSEGAQFFKEGVNFVIFSDSELLGARTGKRFVVDFITLTAALPSADCSLMQVRVDDGAVEYARTVMKLDGNAANLFGRSQAAKMYVDAGQRLLALAFPTPGCDATALRFSVVGHYVDR